MENDNTHDLVLQVRALRQCLSLAKSPIGLFLGAGCPISIRENGKPLIPDIAALTKQIATELSGDVNHKRAFGIISNLLDDSATIEDHLSFTRGLSSIVQCGEVHGMKGAEIDGLEAEICDKIYTYTSATLPNLGTPYHKMARWIAAAVRPNPIEIFTPNYDLLIEQALEDHRIPYFDGFVGSRNPFFDPYAMDEDALPSRWVRLWKLHGSINWALRQEPSGETFVCRSAPTLIAKKERRLIHPSHLKYDESRRMPYLAMIDRLKSFLRTSESRLCICGYSFADVHLNEVIRQGLGANPRSHAFAFLFSGLDSHPRAEKLALECTNLTILSRDKGVIGGRSLEYQSLVEAKHEEPLAVKWTEVIEDGKPQGLFKATSKLGDYSAMADWLQDLTGLELNER